MAQIDFGKLFANGDDQSPTNPPLSQPTPDTTPEPVESSRFRRTRLGRSDWTNIIFVLIAILGGLFLAFYFFNGAELLRSAANWPAEFLYSRPFAQTTPNNIDLAPADSATPPAPVALPSDTESAVPMPREPSASIPTAAPLSIALTNPTTAITDSVPATVLNTLPGPAPGGDGLTRSLEAAADKAETDVVETATERTANLTHVADTTKQSVAAQRRGTRKVASNVKHATRKTVSARNAASEPAFKVDPRLHVDPSPTNSSFGGGAEGGLKSGPVGTLGAGPGVGLGGGAIQTIGLGGGGLPLGLGRH